MSTIRLLPSLLGELFRDPGGLAKRTANRAIRALVQDIIEERIRTTLIITLFHALTTYLGLLLLSETELVSSPTLFTYFYVVTASTVGYGDFSPSTQWGQLFVAFYVVPGAISIFAFIVTKLAASAIFFVRKIMSGFGNFANHKDHLVIIGYVAGQTERLLEEIAQSNNCSETVIVTMKDNLPLPDRIARVRTTSLSAEEDLIRAGIKGAKAIVVMSDTDDETMGAALGISGLGTDAHVVVYFREEAKAKLIKKHCAGFEFVVSTSVNQVSRAIVDPGASEVLAHLASAHLGATLHSLDYKGEDSTVANISAALRKHGATLIGYRHDDATEPTMILTDDTRIGYEHTVFYIAANRLPEETQLAA